MKPMTLEQRQDLQVYTVVVIHDTRIDHWVQGLVRNTRPRILVDLVTGASQTFSIMEKTGPFELYHRNAETIAKVEETKRELLRYEIARCMSRLMPVSYLTPTDEQIQKIAQILTERPEGT